MYETMCHELLFHEGEDKTALYSRSCSCDLVALTETWLSPDNAKNASVVQECADYGYKLFHIPRPTRRGGGVGILVRRGWYFSEG